MFSCFQSSSSNNYPIDAYISGDFKRVSELVKNNILSPTTEIFNQYGRKYGDLLPPCWDGLPLLHVAAMQNKLEIFKILIGEDKIQQKSYVSLNAEITSEKYSGSILHNALHANVRIDMIKLLIEYGADCTAKNSNGYSVLSPLLISEHRERYLFDAEKVAIALEELIKNGAIPNKKEVNALFDFIFKNFGQAKIKLLSTCLEKKFFACNFTDGSNILHYIFQEIQIENNKQFKKSYTELIKKITDGNIDVNAKNPDRYSVLHIAAKNETISAEILQILLDKKIDINCLGPNNQTPLHMAANNTDILILLLENGANINAADADGNNIAHYAANSKSLACLLCCKDLAFDVENKIGKTPLLIAAKKNNIKNVELLLRKGANPFTCLDYGIPDEHILEIISVYANYNQLEAIMDETKPSILSCKVRPENVENLQNLIKNPEALAHYYIKYNPDLNVVDEKGRGIVHYAAVSHKLENILIYKNVLIDVPDDNGMTPLMYAAFKPGNQDSVALLLKYGANILAKDKCDRGIIFYAMQDKKLLTYLNTYINLQNAKHYSFAKSKLSC